MTVITPPIDASESANPYRIASVASAFEVLFAFLRLGNDADRAGVSELARQCGQTKNQTYRLLQTMAEHGIVVQNSDDRTYSLGYRLIELGAAARIRSNLIHAARPTLARVAKESGGVVNLGMLTADFATVLLDSWRDGSSVEDNPPPGKRFALHAGAGSKLLLAFSSDDYFNDYIRVASPLKRFTPYTCVQPSILRQECAQIRANGYALSFQDLDLQRCSIAIPVYDASREVIAGIGTVTQPEAFGEEDRRRYLALLKTASEEISTRLGYRP
jgi:DNA-binding IclR family transcriptional regulator